MQKQKTTSFEVVFIFVYILEVILQSNIPSTSKAKVDSISHIYTFIGIWSVIFNGLVSSGFSYISGIQDIIHIS